MRDPRILEPHADVFVRDVSDPREAVILAGVCRGSILNDEIDTFIENVKYSEETDLYESIVSVERIIDEKKPDEESNRRVSVTKISGRAVKHAPKLFQVTLFKTHNYNVDTRYEEIS